MCKARGNEAWIDPVVDHATSVVSFAVRATGFPRRGTTSRAGARCLLTDSPIPLAHIREEGSAGRLKMTMIGMAAESSGVRTFLPPDPEQIAAAERAVPAWSPDLDLPPRALGFRVQEYGMRSFADLFTPRQLAAIDTFASLVEEARHEATADAIAAGYPPDPRGLAQDGHGAQAYADAVATMLGLCVGRLAQSNNVLVRWYLDARNGSAKAVPAFDRHAVPMVWDFAETNPFGGSVGDWLGPVVSTALLALRLVDPHGKPAKVIQLDARSLPTLISSGSMVATDPPYYDNIGYADLADFFYVWHRRALRQVYPDLLSTLATPKTTELIATPFRHGGDANAAQAYFREGFCQVFSGIAKISRPDVPISVVYAFKEQESDGEGVVSTGWDALLDGLLASNLTIVGTWPIRTARAARMIGIRANALASAIVVVCRRRGDTAPVASRREFLGVLKKELPDAVRALQHGNIAPIDLAQAAIGPGMAAYSRYARVLEADGMPMRVRTALGLINQVLDEVLAEQEAEFDAETRWSLAWFEQHGHADGPYGDAETLSKAKDVSVTGLEAAGILKARAGKVRLLRRDELDPEWDPATDRRLTVWEVTQHLIRALARSESDAAGLLGRVGSLGEAARDLAYRLYTVCDRKAWAEEARDYNTLVVVWPQITRQAAKAEQLKLT